MLQAAESSTDHWHPKKLLIETPFGSCIRSGHLLFVGGIDGFEPGRHLEPGDISEQARRALNAMKGILESAGSSMDQVLKVQMSVAEPNRNLAVLNEIYREFFPDIFPVRSYSGARTSQMGTEGLLCQLSCMAYVD
jgi:2-iminobutanoate/2-iminopropanoate deaminase